MLVPVIHEDLSRPFVLVIEDNPEFLQNAVEGLKEFCTVMTAQTLDEAREIMRQGAVRILLSDVHFPASKGEEPEANVSAVLELAWEHDVPVCFVTRADHHGHLDQGDEGFVSLKALELGDIGATRMKVAREKRQGYPVVGEARLFGCLHSECKKRIFAEGKDAEVWREALQLARNAVAKAGPLAFSIRAVRKIGMDVDMSQRVPTVFRKQ